MPFVQMSYWTSRCRTEASASDSLVRRRIIVPTRSSEMSALTILQSLKESILSQANVKAIYGDPITAHGKTVIPVAKIMYGFGAGAGTGGVGTSSARGEGGGGGWGRRWRSTGCSRGSHRSK